jgi:hypothetical protein
VAAQRSKSMDALYRNIKTVWPGVVIGWVGDPAHATRVSDHNPDDTAGVRAGQTDADSLQEVRALDVMFGPAFRASDAQALVRALTGAKASRLRLFYVIHDGSTWGRPAWDREDYFGDPHTTHVHISGWAGDDANGADWPQVLALGDDMGAIDKVAVRTFLTDILTAHDGQPVDRQVRDLIVGGVHSLADGRGLFSGLASAAAVEELRDSVSALVTAIAGLADQVHQLETAIGQNGNGTTGPTPAQIAEELGARLSTP